MHKYKKAFTLAEIIVVLTLLGVVAAITIPNALDNSSKKSNVVRIKKALPVFERAIEQMRIANNLTNMEELVNYANEGGECANIRKEFKIKKYSDEENASKCIFQTNDGVWWNMTNIEKPIISPLKDGYKYLTDDYANKKLSDEDGKNAFYLTLMQGDGSLGYAFLANDPNHELDDNKCDIKKTLVYAKIMDENELCIKKEKLFSLDIFNTNFDTSLYPNSCAGDTNYCRGGDCQNCYVDAYWENIYYDEQGREIAGVMTNRATNTKGDLCEYTDYEKGESMNCTFCGPYTSLNNCGSGNSNGDLVIRKAFPQDGGTIYTIKCNQNSGCSCIGHTGLSADTVYTSAITFHPVECSGEYNAQDFCTWTTVNGETKYSCK